MSAKFVDYLFEEGNLKVGDIVSCIWSKSCHLLAVCCRSEHDTILIFNSNGSLILSQDEQLKFNFSSKILLFKWNPKIALISIVWSNGQFGNFLIADQSRHQWIEASIPVNHIQNAIVIMKWINQDKLITVTSSNLILVWNLIQITCQLTLNNSYQMNDEIVDLIGIEIDLNKWQAYYGLKSGSFYQINFEPWTVQQLKEIDFSIKQLFFYRSKRHIIILTNNFILYQYSFLSTASSSSYLLSEVSKIKLGMSLNNCKIKMLDEEMGLIAIYSKNEKKVRLLHLETGNNAILNVIDFETSVNITCLDYMNGLLVVGTNNNMVEIRKRNHDLEFFKPNHVVVKGVVQNVFVNKNNQIICSTSANEIYLIEQESMSSDFNGSIAAIQTGSKSVRFFWIEEEKFFDIHLPTRVKFVAISPNGNLSLIKSIGSKGVSLYNISSNFEVTLIKLITIVDTYYPIFFHNECIWCLTLNNFHQPVLSYFKTQDKIQTPTIVKIQKLNENKSSQVVNLNQNSRNLLIVTLTGSNYVYFVYDLEDNNPILKHGPFTFEVLASIQGLAINKNGTFFAFIDHEMVVVIQTTNSQSSKIDYNTTDANKIFWSINEARILTLNNNEVFSIFICTEQNFSIKIFEERSLAVGSKIIGFQIPYIYFINETDNRTISKYALSELDDLSLEATRFMIDALTTDGINLHKVVKNIGQTNYKNEKIWKNLAQIAIKCRDINIGIYCLSKIRKARVIKDIKHQLATNSDVNQALAILAMNLGLYLEAEEILKKSENWLALSRYYQSRNEWSKAIECIDKVNSKYVYYNYAKHLEQEEINIDQAIVYYEKSGTHLYEVPRMLFDIKDNKALKNYCLKNDNEEGKVELISWWGQYCESLGEIKEALAAYQKANDFYNLVRLLCYTGEVEKAKSIMANSNIESELNKDAALLHLGQHFESINPPESINYYLSCGAINHAIRVCKIENMINDLAKIVINYGSIKEAKKFLEQYNQDSTKINTIDDQILIELNYKSKQLDTALNLCLKSRLWSEARNILQKEISLIEEGQQIALDISDDTLNYALNLLKSNSEIIDIVIDVLLIKKGDKSMIKNLILEMNIEINEKLLEKVEKVIKKEPNSQLLTLLAETALKQAQYFVATRLYNSLNDRVSAIKALIRSGFTDRIISYANIARDKTVFKITANYLQTINYPDQKLITTFYKKAGAKNELNRFINQENTNEND